jgi:hypothetical protein
MDIQDCTPVSTQAFELLVEISLQLLTEALKNADFLSPVALIDVAAKLYFTDEQSKRSFLLVRASTMTIPGAVTSIELMIWLL